MRTPPAFVHYIEASAIGEWMRNNLFSMPLINVSHVLCVMLVFGTILIVDLRLLGLLDRGRAVRQVSDEMLGVTWVAFAGAVVSGAMFFSANATTYWFNTAFRYKMLLIALAGVNMAVFQLITWRGVAGWDRNAPTPRAAKVAAAISLLLWISVLVLGRLIGFTKGFDVTLPDNVDFDFGTP